MSIFSSLLYSIITRASVASLKLYTAPAALEEALLVLQRVEPPPREISPSATSLCSFVRFFYFASGDQLAQLDCSRTERRARIIICIANYFFLIAQLRTLFLFRLRRPAYAAGLRQDWKSCTNHNLQHSHPIGKEKVER